MFQKAAEAAPRFPCLRHSGAVLSILVMLGWCACVPLAAQSLRPGGMALRAKARDLAARFPKESKRDVQQRLLGEISSSMSGSTQPKLGEDASFLVNRSGAGAKKPVAATLKAIGKHCYLYVEKGQRLGNGMADKIVQRFDSVLYPQVTAMFGSEWKPGVDNDPRITLFLLSGMADCDGFFDPSDEYTRDKDPESNEREMLYLSIQRLEQDFESFMSHLVAHELQHMIHWNYDTQETFWVEEGLSEYAATLFGHVPWTAQSFFQRPDRCLIDWNDTQDAENYGHVFLFIDFLLNHPSLTPAIRQRLVREIVKSTADGIPSIVGALGKVARTIDFHVVFRDFCLTTFLFHPKYPKASFPYVFRPLLHGALKGYPEAPVTARQTFSAPVGKGRGKVSLWSTAAFAFSLTPRPSLLKVHFTGSTVPTRLGRNTFEVGVAFLDSKRRRAPAVIWLKTRQGAVAKDVRVPAAEYDQALLVVVNRGPNRRHPEEKRWPKAGFSFEVAASPVAQVGQPPQRALVRALLSSSLAAESATSGEGTQIDSLVLEALQADAGAGSTVVREEFEGLQADGTARLCPRKAGHFGALINTNTRFGDLHR